MRAALLVLLLAALPTASLGVAPPHRAWSQERWDVPPGARVDGPGTVALVRVPALRETATSPVFGGEIRMPGVQDGEPATKAAPDGTLYVYAPGYLARSIDNGSGWTRVPLGGFTGPVTCGCDSDVALDARGNLLYTDLAYPQTVNVGWSPDQGNHWASNYQATGLDKNVDRQWIETDGASTTYMTYRQGPAIYMVTAPTSPAPAFLPSIITTSSNTGRAGYLAVDRPDSIAYAFYMSDNSIRVDRVTQLGQTVDDLLVADDIGDPGDSFPAGAVDDAGNVYAVWSSEDAVNGATVTDVYYAASTDQGTTWSAPVKLNQAPATAVYPWAVAGADGRLGVVYYGTSQATLPGSVTGDWYVYYNLVTGAHGASPSLDEVPLVPHRVKTGPLCTFGTGCGKNGDRSFLDYFGVHRTADGRAIVAFNDQEALTQGKTPYIHFAQQVDGPRLE